MGVISEAWQSRAIPAWSRLRRLTTPKQEVNNDSRDAATQAALKTLFASRVHFLVVLDTSTAFWGREILGSETLAPMVAGKWIFLLPRPTIQGAHDSVP